MSGVAVCKRKPKPRKPSKTEVDGLNMNGIQGTIRWTGLVHLDQTNEDLECLLSETVWPRKTGASYFACASTGLLFDKQTGECRQSRKMRLRLDTVAESRKSRAEFRKWMAGKNSAYLWTQKKKPGPKPGSKRGAFDEIPEDSDDGIID